MDRLSLAGPPKKKCILNDWAEKQFYLTLHP